MRRSPRHRVAALLLAAVLAATPVLAAPAPRQALGTFASLWQALERFLPSFGKGLSTIDPDGEPAPAGNTVSGGETEGRAGLDPDG
jgi:hypothetical protein